MNHSLKRRDFFGSLGKGAAALTLSELAGRATETGLARPARRALAALQRAAALGMAVPLLMTSAPL